VGQIQGMAKYKYRCPREDWSEVFGTMLGVMNTHHREYATGLQMLLGRWIRERIELYGPGKGLSLERLDRGARMRDQSPMAHIAYLFGQPTPEKWMMEFIVCADFDFTGARKKAA